MKIFLYGFLLTSIGGFGCKPRKGSDSDVKGGVVRSDDVPAIGYHFGEYKYLAKYGDRNSTFNETEWGDIPSTSYAPGEEGFYFSQHPAYNEVYGQDALYKKDTGWMVEISIAAHCRDRDRVLWTRMSPELDPRFASSKSLRGTFASADQYIKTCRATGKSADVVKKCNLVTKNFLDEVDIKIIRDTLWANGKTGYWMVRDPSCITSIKASPSSVLRVLGSVEEIWNRKPFTDDIERRSKDAPGISTLIILTKALEVVDDWNKVNFDSLFGNLKSSDLPGTKSAAESILSAASGCKGKPGESDLRQSMRELFSSIVSHDNQANKTDKQPFETLLNVWLFNIGGIACASEFPRTAESIASLKVIKHTQFSSVPVKVGCATGITQEECDIALGSLGKQIPKYTQATYSTKEIKLGEFAFSTSNYVFLDMRKPEESLARLKTRMQIVKEGLLGLFVPAKPFDIAVECMKEEFGARKFSFSNAQCSSAIQRLDQSLASWQDDPSILGIHTFNFGTKTKWKTFYAMIELDINASIEEINLALSQRAALRRKPFGSGVVGNITFYCHHSVSSEDCISSVERFYNNTIDKNPEFKTKIQKLDIWVSAKNDFVSKDAIHLSKDETDSGFEKILRDIMN
ncbi:MAG: hypothetical protein NT027_16970 [Proteobacteria bacterium]|nr:hypothetical protein [Pseudomonadota bacterium]